MLNAIRTIKNKLNREQIIDLRRMICARINIEFNVMMSHPAEESEAIDQRIQTWNFPLQAIPVECLYDSFVYAMQIRDHTFKITPPELISAYKQLLNGAKIQTDIENNFDPRRALAENAAAACERCFGRGREIIHDSNGYTNAKDCDHAPLSESEIADRDEAKRKFDLALDQLRRNKFELHKPTEPKAEKPPEVLICPECRREAAESKTIRSLKNCRDMFAQDSSGAINRCPGMLFYKKSIVIKEKNESEEKQTQQKPSEKSGIKKQADQR